MGDIGMSCRPRLFTVGRSHEEATYRDLLFEHASQMADTLLRLCCVARLPGRRILRNAPDKAVSHSTNFMVPPIPGPSTADDLLHKTPQPLRPRLQEAIATYRLSISACRGPRLHGLCIIVPFTLMIAATARTEDGSLDRQYPNHSSDHVAYPATAANSLQKLFSKIDFKN
jgi:hypothetical protein